MPFTTFMPTKQVAMNDAEAKVKDVNGALGCQGACTCDGAELQTAQTVRDLGINTCSQQVCRQRSQSTHMPVQPAVWGIFLTQ